MYSSTIGRPPPPRKAKFGVDKASALNGAALGDDAIGNTALTVADTFNETFSGGDAESPTGSHDGYNGGECSDCASTGPTSLANTGSNYSNPNYGGHRGAGEGGKGSRRTCGMTTPAMPQAAGEAGGGRGGSL